MANFPEFELARLPFHADDSLRVLVISRHSPAFLFTNLPTSQVASCPLPSFRPLSLSVSFSKAPLLSYIQKP